MAILKIVGSNSAGNGYILDDGNNILIIELGCNWNDYLRLLDYDIERVGGCITSHIHQDHSKDATVNKILSLGIPIYSCQDVADKYKGVKTMELKHKYKIGSFAIQPFELFHNVQCYGYLIENNSFGRLLFVTDTNQVPYRFKNINHILIESNYSDNMIIDNYVEGHFNSSASNNHLSIEQCIEVLKQNYSASLQNIVLLHLSNGNSDSRKFKKSVQEELSFDNVTIAKQNVIIELNKSEFLTK